MLSTQVKSVEQLKEMLSKVNHPEHYNIGKIEVIDAIEDWDLDFHLGNVLKYIVRAGVKDPLTYLEDLEKAKWYLDRKIKTLKTKSFEGPTKL